MLKRVICIFIAVTILLTFCLSTGVFARETHKGNLELSRDSGCYIDENGFMIGVKENTSVNDFMSLFTEDQNILADKIATGAVVTKYINEVPSDRATIVIKGDTNGDGKVGSSDYFVIKRILMSSDSFDQVVFAAGDTDNNGRISSSDYMAVKGYLKGIHNLYSTPERVEDMIIVENGSSKFRIVYGDNVNQETIRAFQTIVETKTHCFLEAVQQNDAYAIGEHEILVEIVDSLENGQYTIKVSEGKIFLSGADEYAVSLAIKEFYNQSLSGTSMKLPGEYFYKNAYFYPIAVTEQNEDRVVIYNTAEGGLNNPADYFATKGFSVAGIRFREYDQAKVVLATGTNYAKMTDYHTGRILWSCNYVQLTSETGNYNAHAIELMPNGVIAVAGSSANAITFFDSATKNHSNRVRIDFTDAHGAIWDPHNNVLWACGKKIIRGYEVTLENGVIAVSPKYDDVILPTDNAHDFQPVYGQPGKYWVTTGSKVYIFDSATRTVSDIPSDIGLTVKKVKGIGSFADGSVFQSVATGSNESWQTDTVKGFLYNSLLDIYYPVNYVNSELYIYKVHVVNFDYQ